MAAIKPIRTEMDYDEALARIEQIFQAEVGTPEGDERDVLVDLVELYEQRHHPIDSPSAIAAIEHEMDQRGMSRRDLIPLIGGSAKVSEVLSGKRDITMTMARALHQHLGIPADILLQKSGASAEDDLSELDPLRFPLREMAKRGWIPDVPDSEMKHYAAELIEGLVGRAGVRDLNVGPLYRMNDHCRMNAKTDPYALRAWCWQVLALANRQRHVPYEPDSITPEFLRKVARRSTDQQGSLLASDLLRERGIPLITLPQLPRTYLDGAALWSADRRPVIALTLRHDRIDSFWFCLLHELAHVALHLDEENGVFVDDLSLQPEREYQLDSRELEADRYAEEALVPRDVWEKSGARHDPTTISVINFAQSIGVHPAVVAGRIRHERGNQRLLSQLVGSGQVRAQFDDEVG